MPASSTGARSLSPGDRVSEANERLPENELQMAAITFIAAWHTLAPQFKNNANKVQSESLASFKIARSKPLICKEFSKLLDDGLYIKY